MGERKFRTLLEDRWSLGNFVCVGLDPEVEKLPEPLKLRYTEYSQTTPGSQFIAFCEGIVNATSDLVCAYKPNLGFFLRHGAQGWDALERIIKRIHEIAPEVPVILDAKFGDIDNTNEGYAAAAFDDLKADAVTVHPYLGSEATEPFLKRADKGVFALCRTSNSGAGEFQDIRVPMGVAMNDGPLIRPFYQTVALRVANSWNKNGNCGLVVGATYPQELHEVRQLVGDMPILMPGIGAQGGDVESTVRAGKDSRGAGMIINSGRAVIYASGGADYIDAARRKTEKLHDEINLHLNKA